MGVKLLETAAVLVTAAALFVVVAVATGTNTECLRSCGTVDIPYPFGTTDDCRYVDQDNSFLVTCNDTAFDPPKPFLGSSNIEVTSISVTDGEMKILQLAATDCYNNGTRTESSTPRKSLRIGTLTISPTRNKFMAMGCDTSAVLAGRLGNDTFNTGCFSYCSGESYVDDSCSGVGCCQIPIPEGLWTIEVQLRSYYNNHTNVSHFNNCSYALAVVNEFNFSARYLREFDQEKVPLVLDWTVGNQTCEMAKKDTSSYLCRDSSDCVDRLSRGSPAYLCKCSDGYQGNPYVDGCCTDIKECANPDWNNCEGKCIEQLGNYTCQCPEGYRGDGRKDGEGCTRKPSMVLELALGSGLGCLAFLLIVSWFFLGHRSRKATKLRQKQFEQNGGRLLRQKLTTPSHEGHEFRIFSSYELKRATRNYHESRILGQGGQGTVYKGILPDGTKVAIKKSKIGEPSEVDNFVKEIFMLSQLQHENVVKILGCCLETQVPLLVYEFVSNGSLFDHMHRRLSRIPWDTRLKIAAQTAQALSYLHSATSGPIVHRDVKLENILIDENHNAKVSDFGASRLIPVNQVEFATLVQGTIGYLDPEYMHTGQLNEKSDVYSFGIVLIELLTGRRAIEFERPEGERNLVVSFVSSMKENHLLEILDNRFLEMSEGNVVEQLEEVADIAKMCVRLRGEERPSMLEVASELEGLRTMSSNLPLSQTKRELRVLVEENEYLLGDLYSGPYDDTVSSSS